VTTGFDFLDPQMLISVAAGVILLLILLRIPYLGGLLRFLFSAAMLVLIVVLIVQRAPFDPFLARLMSRLNLDTQEVVGKELRIRMAGNGHFMATARINGVERRMLIDSGATITALSARTAAAAGLEPQADVVPVVIRTANGVIPAQTATVDVIAVGNITARNLKVVISPAFGDVDVLGMNFLSKLQSWRVEDNILVLVPHHPQPVSR
jgi:aspartyl protease family protein